jgi:hypothetical protein
MKKNLLTALVIGCVILVFLVVTSKLIIIECFGTSPGTMDQLQSSHVPTQEDVNYFNFVLPKIVRKDITDMTGGDPGVISPLTIPIGVAYVPMG